MKQRSGNSKKVFFKNAIEKNNVTEMNNGLISKPDMVEESLILRLSPYKLPKLKIKKRKEQNRISKYCGTSTKVIYRCNGITRGEKKEKGTEEKKYLK